MPYDITGICKGRSVPSGDLPTYNTSAGGGQPTGTTTCTFSNQASTCIAGTQCLADVIQQGSDGTANSSTNRTGICSLFLKGSGESISKNTEPTQGGFAYVYNCTSNVPGSGIATSQGNYPVCRKELSDIVPPVNALGSLGEFCYANNENSCIFPSGTGGITNLRCTTFSASEGIPGGVCQVDEGQ
jgi:hypothetical protein